MILVSKDFIFQMIFMVIALYTLIYYYDSFFTLRKRSVFIVSIAAYVLIQVFMESRGTNSPYLNLLINVIVVVAFGVFTYIGSKIKIILSGVLYCVMWLMSEIMLMFVLMILKIQYAHVELVGSFITKLILLVMVKLINDHFTKRNSPDMPRKYNAVVLLVPISSILIIACIFYIADRNYTGQMAVISSIASSVLLITNLIVIKLYDKVVEELVLKNLNNLYAKQLQLCEQQVMEREETMLSIRSMRHDMKNHLVLIRETLDNKNLEKAEEYIDSLIVDTISKKEIVVNTGNVVIDSLVNFKHAIAEKEGIEFKTNIVVPYNLPCEDADICIILGNILDNAIEAATLVEEGKRYINLNITAKRNNLAIVMKNSFVHKIQKGMDGIIVTSKQNKQEHGYGLISVNRAVEKYNGTMNIEYTENEFIVTIILFISYD